MVGFDGVVYLDALTEHNTVTVSTATAVCQARFDYHKSGDDIPAIGPLVCQRSASP
jgi:outer membrane usher protein